MFNDYIYTRITSINHPVNSELIFLCKLYPSRYSRISIGIVDASSRIIYKGINI